MVKRSVVIFFILLIQCIPYYVFKKTEYDNDKDLVSRKEAAREFLPYVILAQKIFKEKFPDYYILDFLPNIFALTSMNSPRNSFNCDYFDAIISLNDCREYYIERDFLNSCIILALDWINHPVVSSAILGYLDYYTSTPIHWCSVEIVGSMGEIPIM
jgi:hypothetical protein